MNKLITTPKGFLLISADHIPPGDAREMAEQLKAITGASWVVMGLTEFDAEASKYIEIGKKTEEIIKSLDI